MNNVRKEILECAETAVTGARSDVYGSPEDNFATIADFWTVYKQVPFTVQDVAMMMALLKIARIQTGIGSLDSFVDLAGYAACGGELWKKNAKSHSVEEEDAVPDNEYEA